MVGTWMQATAQAWLVYSLTLSASWLGVITFCSQLPAFILSPFAGVALDRWNRRKVLLWAQVLAMVEAVILSVLIFTGKIQVWHIGVTSVLLGISAAFDHAGRHVLGYDLVGQENLSSAVTLNAVTFHGSRVIGPALAGIVIQIAGEGWCFLLNALSFLAVIGGLGLIRLSQIPKRDLTRLKPLSQIGDAIRYISKTPGIPRLLFHSCFFCFVGFPYVVLLPVFAKTVLGGNAQTLAWLTSASGLGSVLGAISVGNVRAEDFERDLALDMVFLGSSLAALGASQHFWFSMLATFGSGFFYIRIWPRINTLIQEKVSDTMRGRVMSLYSMTFLGAMPLGCALAGDLADRFTARNVEFGAGLIFFLAGLRNLWRAHCLSQAQPVGSKP